VIPSYPSPLPAGMDSPEKTFQISQPKKKRKEKAFDIASGFSEAVWVVFSIIGISYFVWLKGVG